jgi:hypothetical protein
MYTYLLRATHNRQSFPDSTMVVVSTMTFGMVRAYLDRQGGKACLGLPTGVKKGLLVRTTAGQAVHSEQMAIRGAFSAST